MALQARPNPAHYALAQLAKAKSGFVTLSQNVDGLSQRAGHPASQLHLLHGSLFDVKCTSFYCNYFQHDNFTDPIVPALAIPQESVQPNPSSTDVTGAEATSSLYGAMQSANNGSQASRDLDISDAGVSIPQIPPSQLPKCPHCRDGLLRPGVVWFGERLPEVTLQAVEKFIEDSEKIDLMLVVGTSARVHPAAGYVDEAREKGARVAVINTDIADTPGGGLEEDDWFFEGDAGVILPEILKSVIGEISMPGPAQFPIAQVQ